MINNHSAKLLNDKLNYSHNNYDKRFRMKNVPDFNFEKASKNFQLIYNKYYNSLKESEKFVKKNKNNFSQFFSDLKKISKENEKDYFLREIKKENIIYNEMKNNFGLKAYEYYNDYNIMNSMKIFANNNGEKIKKKNCIPKTISLKYYKRFKNINNENNENNSYEEKLLIPLPKIFYKKNKYSHKIKIKINNELDNSYNNNKNKKINFSKNYFNSYSNIFNSNLLISKDKNNSAKSLNNILNDLDNLKNIYENINTQYYNYYYNKEKKIFNKEKIKIDKLYEKFK